MVIPWRVPAVCFGLVERLPACCHSYTNKPEAHVHAIAVLSSGFTPCALTISHRLCLLPPRHSELQGSSRLPQPCTVALPNQRLQHIRSMCMHNRKHSVKPMLRSLQATHELGVSGIITQQPTVSCFTALLQKDENRAVASNMGRSTVFWCPTHS